MGRSRCGRRGPFSTRPHEMLRVDGEEHGHRSAMKITRVVSAEVPPQAFRKRAHFDWSVAERSNVVRLARCSRRRDRKNPTAAHARAGVRTFA